MSDSIRTKRKWWRQNIIRRLFVSYLLCELYSLIRRTDIHAGKLHLYLILTTTSQIYQNWSLNKSFFKSSRWFQTTGTAKRGGRYLKGIYLNLNELNTKIFMEYSRLEVVGVILIGFWYILFRRLPPIICEPFIYANRLLTLTSRLKFVPDHILYLHKIDFNSDFSLSE